MFTRTTAALTLALSLAGSLTASTAEASLPPSDIDTAMIVPMPQVAADCTPTIRVALVTGCTPEAAPVIELPDADALYVPREAATSAFA